MGLDRRDLQSPQLPPTRRPEVDAALVSDDRSRLLAPLNVIHDPGLSASLQSIGGWFRRPVRWRHAWTAPIRLETHINRDAGREMPQLVFDLGMNDGDETGY